MNKPKDTFPVGTPVTFHAAFRQWEGRIDSYTPTGRAVVVTDEGRQFTLTPDQLVMMQGLAKHYASNYDPAAEGMLAGQRAAALDEAPFKVGDAVEVGQVGVPAKVVGISADGLTLEVIYEDMVEVFEADACNVTLLTEKPKSVVRRVAELERQVAELQRQVATLLQTLNSTPRS